MRPVIVGSGASLGVSSAKEFTFAVVVNPVGDYYKTPIAGIKAIVHTDFDRAAPRGIGQSKAGGNQVADLQPNREAKKQGFQTGLQLDARQNRQIEEFSVSNFVAIIKGEQVTPDSSSILKSITNKTLRELASKKLGIKVTDRQIDFLKEVDSFDEVGSIGTAVIITPVKELH